MKASGKDRRSKEVVYGALQALDFATFNLAANVANTSIQARFPLLSNWQIGQVAVVLGGTAAGTCSFNIVAGESAEGSTMVDDTSDFGPTAEWTINNTGGTLMFATDQSVTMTTGLVQAFTPAFPNGIWGSCELTVRVATNGSATAGESLTVVMYGRPVDIYPTRTMSSNPPAPFSWPTI